MAERRLDHRLGGVLGDRLTESRHQLLLEIQFLAHLRAPPFTDAILHANRPRKRTDWRMAIAAPARHDTARQETDLGAKGWAWP